MLFSGTTSFDTILKQPQYHANTDYEGVQQPSYGVYIDDGVLYGNTLVNFVPQFVDFNGGEVMYYQDQCQQPQH